MKKFATNVILAAVLLLLGPRHDGAPNPGWMENFQGSAIFTYLAQHASTAAPLAWMEESETQDQAIIALGYDLGWRFERRYTVKVDKKSGEVFQLEYDDRGEEIWVRAGKNFLPA